MSSSVAFIGIRSSVDLLIEQHLPIWYWGCIILCLGEVILCFSTFWSRGIYDRYLTSFHHLFTLNCRSGPFSSTGISSEIFRNRKYFLFHWNVNMNEICRGKFKCTRILIYSLQTLGISKIPRYSLISFSLSITRGAKRNGLCCVPLSNGHPVSTDGLASHASTLLYPVRGVLHCGVSMGLRHRRGIDQDAYHMTWILGVIISTNCSAMRFHCTMIRKTCAALRW